MSKSPLSLTGMVAVAGEASLEKPNISISQYSKSTSHDRTINPTATGQAYRQYSSPRPGNRSNRISTKKSTIAKQPNSHQANTAAIRSPGPRRSTKNQSNRSSNTSSKQPANPLQSSQHHPRNLTRKPKASQSLTDPRSSSTITTKPTSASADHSSPRHSHSKLTEAFSTLQVPGCQACTTKTLTSGINA